MLWHVRCMVKLITLGRKRLGIKQFIQSTETSRLNDQCSIVGPLPCWGCGFWMRFHNGWDICFIKDLKAEQGNFQDLNNIIIQSTSQKSMVIIPLLFVGVCRAQSDCHLFYSTKCSFLDTQRFWIVKVFCSMWSFQLRDKSHNFSMACDRSHMTTSNCSLAEENWPKYVTSVFYWPTQAPGTTAWNMSVGILRPWLYFWLVNLIFH